MATTRRENIYAEKNNCSTNALSQQPEGGMPKGWAVREGIVAFKENIKFLLWTDMSPSRTSFLWIAGNLQDFFSWVKEQAKSNYTGLARCYQVFSNHALILSMISMRFQSLAARSKKAVTPFGPLTQLYYILMITSCWTQSRSGGLDNIGWWIIDKNTIGLECWFKEFFIDWYQKLRAF